MSVKLRRKKVSSGGYSLYLDIYHSGRRYYEFLNLCLTKDRNANKETHQLAESIRARRQLEIQNSDHGFIPHFKRKANFVTYFEKIALDKPKTEKAWPNTLKHLRDYTGGSIQFSAINDEWLEQFKAYLITKVTANTAITYFAKIKAALKKSVKDKILITNPADNVAQFKRIGTQRDYLILAEIEVLAKTPCSHPEVKRAFLFSCFTGLRLSDIIKLDWQSIQNDRIEFRQQKTKDVEYFPLSETAQRLLHPLDGKANIISLQSQTVFNLPSPTLINRVLKKWKEAAGITKHVTFHVARHTFATLSLTQGTDLYTVSKLLGHKSIQNTQIYAKIVDEKKREAVDRLPKINLI